MLGVCATVVACLGPAIPAFRDANGGFLAPRVAAAQAPAWTADDAVVRALSRPEIEALRDAGLEGVRAEMRETLVRPAPTLGFDYEDERDDGGVATREYSARLETSVDVFPWRGRLKQALRHREAAFLAGDDGFRLDVAAEVRIAFYSVRHHEQRVEALARWVDRLDQGWRSLLAREQRGDASAYEVQRLERELQVARAEQAREESMLEQAWLGLQRWCSWEMRPVLRGELPPSGTDSGALERGEGAPSVSSSGSEPAERSGSFARGTEPGASEARGPKGSPELEETVPELARLANLQRSVDSELRAWGRPFLRGWTLGGGYRSIDVGSETHDGALFSVSLPLPLWNTDGPRQDRLRAERLRIESELRLERRRTVDAIDSAGRRLSRLLEAAAALPPADRDAELTGRAEAAYAAGEASLTELLDAYQSEAELELARTDLQWEARRASIELDRRRGMGVPR